MTEEARGKGEEKGLFSKSHSDKSEMREQSDGMTQIT